MSHHVSLKAHYYVQGQKSRGWREAQVSSSESNGLWAVAIQGTSIFIGVLQKPQKDRKGTP